MIGKQGARSCRAAALAALVACVGGMGCGDKDLHATYDYPMAGCHPLARCSARPEITGLDGHAPTFRLHDGQSLPAWASLDETTGEVSGVPLESEDLLVAIDMTVAGYEGTLYAWLSLTVDPLVFHLCYDAGEFSPDQLGLPVAPIHACIGADRYLMSLAEGVTKAFSLTSGELPPGVALDAATGVLSGVPTMDGRFDFEVTAHLEYQLTSFTLVDWGTFVVSPLPSVFRYPTPPYPADSVSLQVGQAVSVAPDLTALHPESGTVVTGFHVTAGALPPGLTVDGDTGVVSGTPDLSRIPVGTGPTAYISATLTRGSATSTVTAGLRFKRVN